MENTSKVTFICDKCGTPLDGKSYISVTGFTVCMKCIIESSKVFPYSPHEGVCNCNMPYAPVYHDDVERCSICNLPKS